MSEQVPVGWALSTMDDLVGKITSGGTPKVGNSDYYNGGIPFLKIDDLTSSGKIVSTSKETITEKAISETSAKVFPSGTVVTTMYGTIGVTRVLGKPMATNQAIAAFLDPKGLTPEFLLQTIDNDASKLASVSSQTTQANISATVLKQHQILTPPLPEQQKIASILTSVDEVIEKTQSQINKLQDLKKGTMNELLTRGIGHTEFKDSPVGRIPKSWEIVQLVDVTSKISDGIHATPKYTDISDYFFVNGNNLKNGELVITETTKCVSKEEYLKHKKELNKQTILMSINGTIGNLSYYNDETVILGKSAAYINLLNTVSKHFIFYYLGWESTQTFFENELSASTIRNLSLKTIKETPLFFPPIHEQEKIASILSSIDYKIYKNKQKFEHVKSLKQSLMQDLLTGKVRVQVN